MRQRRIPFNRPWLSGNELAYIRQAIENNHISGDGLFTKKCNRLFEEELQVRKAFLTTSCTHALEMSALLLNIGPGDEVIVPSFTFVSTVNAFVLRGAKPVFSDITTDTLNLDHAKLEALITPKTKAIIAVHYAGVGCDMDAILDIAQRHSIPIVEDNAHGLFAKYKNRYLGTFGCLAAQSFHETKNFTSGEGGALLINDDRFIERSEVIREKGTNRTRFFRGQVDKYTWIDVGSSYLPSDILAAFLYAQLESRNEIQRRRALIWNYYYQSLQYWAREHNIRLPIVPSHCEQSYHLFYLVLPSLESRTALIEHLKARGIDAVFHYQPLHLSEMGRSFGGKEGDCLVTEYVSDRLLRLPFYNALTQPDQEYIVSAIKECKGL
jgi:dTDP-4-amino-4,6-dideoxygalactose transaminase